MTQDRVNQKIMIETIEVVSELLNRLEPKIKLKPISELSQSEKLLNLRPKIERVLQLGYSYEEITEVLKQQDINVSTEKLKRYLSNTSDRDD